MDPLLECVVSHMDMEGTKQVQGDSLLLHLPPLRLLVNHLSACPLSDRISGPSSVTAQHSNGQLQEQLMAFQGLLQGQINKVVS